MTSLIKPARWALTPGLTDPKWDWVWDGLVNGLFFLEGQGQPVSVGRFPQTAVLTATPAWVTNTAGIGMEFNSTDDRLGFPDKLMEGGFLNKRHTIIAVWEHDGTFNGFAYLLNSRGTGVGLGMGFNGSTAFTTVEVAGGASSFLTRSTALSAGLHAWAFQWDGANTLSLFDDGVELTETISGTKNTPQHPLQIGNSFGTPRILELNNNAVAGRTLYALYFMDTAPPKAALLQLLRDPFGPFRMVDEVGVVVGLPAPPVGGNPLASSLMMTGVGF